MLHSLLLRVEFCFVLFFPDSIYCFACFYELGLSFFLLLFFFKNFFFVDMCLWVVLSREFLWLLIINSGVWLIMLVLLLRKREKIMSNWVWLDYSDNDIQSSYYSFLEQNCY